MGVVNVSQPFKDLCTRTTCQHGHARRAAKPCNELPPSFDHLIGEREQVHRDFETKRFGGIEIDRQLEER
jgi:hypothetical protein